MSQLVAAKMQEKRQRILECAQEVFAEKGYVNTPVRDIIDRSGFGTGTFYKHFASKEAVLTTLLEDFLAQIVGSVNQYYSGEDDLYLRFIETKRVILQVYIDNAGLSEIYSRAAGISDGIDRCLNNFDRQFLVFTSKNIRYGIKKGIFRDLPVDPIAHSILAIIKYAVYKWVVLKEYSEEEMIEMVLSFHRSLATGLVKPESVQSPEQ